LNLVDNDNRYIDITDSFDALCNVSDFFSVAADGLLLSKDDVATIYIPFDFVGSFAHDIAMCLKSLHGLAMWRIESSARSVAGAFMTAAFYDIPSVRPALQEVIGGMLNGAFFGFLDELMGAREYVRGDAHRVYGAEVIDRAMARICAWARELVEPELWRRSDQLAEEGEWSYLAHLVTTHAPLAMLYGIGDRERAGGAGAVFCNAVSQSLTDILLHEDNHEDSFDERLRLHLAVCEILDVNPNIWGDEEEEDDEAEEDDDEPEEDEVLTPQSAAARARMRADRAAVDAAREGWAEAGVFVRPNSHKKNGTGSSKMASRKNCEKARAKRSSDFARQRQANGTKQQAATLFCFIMLITGTGYAAVEMMCAFLGVPTPSSSTLYSVQLRVVARILEMAVISAAMAAQVVAADAVLAFDGAWNHPRWGTQCLGCFIDLKQKKVVDFRVVRKKGKTTRDSAAVDASSQALEGIAFDGLAKTWAKRGRGIRGLVHDRNGQVTKIVRKLGWRVVERFDRNHVVLSMCRAFKRFAKVLPAGKKRRMTVLGKDIQSEATKWFRVCMNDPKPLSARRDMWTSAVDWWTRASSTWKRKTDSVAVGQITSFLHATVHLLDSVEAGFSTQISEALNARWVHLASKLIAWGPSWIARIAVAILNFNEGHRWKLWAYDQLKGEFGWPELTERSRIFLERTFAKSASEQARRGTAEFQRKANAARWERRNGNAKAKATDTKKGLPTHTSGQDVSDDDMESDDMDDGAGTEDVPQISPETLMLALQERPDVPELDAPIPIDANGVYPICCFLNPGCWCHLCALISALLGIGCISDAIMAVANPLPLVLALQRVIIASAASPDFAVPLGEVASAINALIIHPRNTPFFQADQDPAHDDLPLVFDALLSQDGVVFRDLLGVVLSLDLGSSAGELGPDGALAPQAPGTEHLAPFLRVASNGLDEALEGIRRARFGRRIIAKLPRVLTLVIDIRAQEAETGVELPGAIGVTPADGGESVQYRLVSIVLQHLGPRGHCTSQTVAVADDGTSMWRTRDDGRGGFEAGDGFGGFCGRARIAFFVRDFILQGE
jgi:hypothetical protein